MKLKKITAVLLSVFMSLSVLSFSGCTKTDNKIGIGLQTTAKASLGNSPGNISNLGGVAEHKGKIYYQNGDDNFSIYCSEADGSNPVKLNSSQSYFINVTDDYIIYANADDDYHIYKMNIDGSENVKLNDVQSYYVNLYNDTIYYSNWSDENKIYRMNVDGSNNEVICDDQSYYVTVDDDKIYYSNWSDGAKLYSIGIDGSSKLKLADTGCWYIVPDDEWVYYSQWTQNGNEQQDSEQADDKFLCRVKKDGAATEVLNEVPCGDINVYKDRVYFTNWLENNIYSMNTDGSDVKKLSDSYGVYLNIAEDRLYYIEYGENDSITIKNIAIEGEDI